MTGYRCPKCGQEDEFFADVVEAVFWGCRIDEWGWDYSGSDGDVNFADTTTLRCEKCGYEGSPEQFEEG